MHDSTQFTYRMLAAFCGVAFTIPTTAYALFLVRTLHLALIGENSAAYRSGTVLGLAMFFLLVTAACGLIAFKSLKMARRGFERK